MDIYGKKELESVMEYLGELTMNISLLEPSYGNTL